MEHEISGGSVDVCTNPGRASFRTFRKRADSGQFLNQPQSTYSHFRGTLEWRCDPGNNRTTCSPKEQLNPYAHKRQVFLQSNRLDFSILSSFF